jgi:RND family efflux transporter MFP subunit
MESPIMSRRTLIPSSLAIAGLALIAFTTSGCHRATATGDKQAQAVLTVETITTLQREVPTSIDTAGVLAPWQEISIGAEVSGYRISEIFVDVGTQVSKGRVLAKLDETLLRAEVDQRAAAVAETEASYAEARANADRTTALLKRGASSEQEAIQKTTAAATAAARVASAQAQLSTAQQKLSYATIVAPDYGVISARTVSVGQLSPAGTDLFKMIRQNRVEWRAEIPEAQIGNVRVGMPARVRRADGTFAEGRIRAIAPALDSNTRRGIAYVDLKLENGIRPGMFASGSIELGKQQARLLPLAAVTVRDGFSYVFILGEDHKVTQRRVEVGRFFSDGVEIIGGIAPADPIVAQGAGFLRDGDQVRVTTGQLAKN